MSPSTASTSLHLPFVGVVPHSGDSCEVANHKATEDFPSGGGGCGGVRQSTWWERGSPVVYHLSAPGFFYWPVFKLKSWYLLVCT